MFAGFELVREKMEKGKTFEQALASSRNEIVFTTHTPVVQGNESHYLDRMLYMGADNGVFTKQQLKQLGGSPFNMTVGALRLSRKANAVAQLHAVTANKMWQGVKDRADIVGITNAIHIPTWVDRKIVAAAKADSADIWKLHQQNKRQLLDFVYQRTGVRLKQDSLLLGFSRRAVPYKRSDLIFSDRSKVDRLFKSGKLQIIFSGKAHPLDDGGKRIVANIVALTKKYPKSVVFLENYDMTIGSMLVRGADVWLNNPRRPQEASGTSGMKAAMNGVLNLSILDGWWPEACRDGVNGWQIGNGYENKNENKLDAHDQKALYNVLLGKVLPKYYNDKKGWIEMMKQSTLDTSKTFAVKRMLEEYYDKLYTTSVEVNE